MKKLFVMAALCLVSMGPAESKLGTGTAGGFTRCAYRQFCDV